MAVLPQALTTLDNVKLFLDITAASDDALLEELIDAKTEFIEGQLGGRRIKEETDIVESHDGGEKEIFLNNYPVTPTTTFVAEFRSGALSSPTFTAFTGDDFIVYEESGFVHFLARTPGYHFDAAAVRGNSPHLVPGHQNIRITYSAGFITIPGDLELLTKELVAQTFKKRKSQGIKIEKVEGVSVEYFGGDDSRTTLNDEQKSILEKYKRYNVGENF